MQPESSHDSTAALYQAWAWFEAHKKQVIYGAVAAAALGLIIFFVVWRKNETQRAASSAFSKAFVAQMVVGDTNTAGLQKVASDFTGTPAARRAELLLATTLFTEGKYAEAHAAFQKFTRDHGGTPLAPQAFLGIAASLEAQGKTNEAVHAYEDVRNRYSTENVAPQARFALARLYQSQNRLKESLQIYEDLNRSHRGTTIGSEAGGLAEDIKLKHPELVPPPVIPTNTTPVFKPAPAPVTTNAAPATNTPAK
jgi:tetratricopeptide (TPR) repeat protein